MIIVDPVVLGDVPFTRASPKWVYDRTGTLVEVPANTVGVTYDPADLSKAPWALVESAAINRIRNNTMQGAVVGTLGSGGAIPTFWQTDFGANQKMEILDIQPDGTGFAYMDVRLYSAASDRGYLAIYPEPTHSSSSLNSAVVAEGQAWYFSQYIKHINGVLPNNVQMTVRAVNGAGAGISDSASGPLNIAGVNAPIRMTRQSISMPSTPAGTARLDCFLIIFITPGQPYDFTLRIGLPQVQRDRIDSPIKTSGSAVTRAADVVGAGAGLVYSNVPMVELPYNAATTYAKDAAVYDPATKIVYWSMVAANVGKPLSDANFWNKRTAINRWAMFDDRNSTQTSNPEDIVSVFSAQAITQGLFAGAMDASEVRVSMTHPTRGLVFSETKSLVLPRSGSSFFGWCFNRLRLRTWFLTLKLPVFANALVTVTIKKPGGVPKCGMCLLGPTVDVGLSLMGLSTELKDYSTTTFFTDGSSSTVERGFSKKMSVDISVESDRVETIEDDLIKRRQKTLVFLGSTMRGDTMLVGRFSSLRKVIDSFPRSKMALQIDGVLSQ
jgi:hypothetical protein